MPNKVDSYHLIQFVLHAADNYGGGDWHMFMAKLEKMYKGNIHVSVLHGLMRKNIHELSTLCIDQLEKGRMKTQHQHIVQAEQALKVKKWMDRVNKGNHEAFKIVWERQKNVEKARAQQKEDERKLLDDYIASMKPVWDNDTKKLIERRLNEICDLMLK